MTKKIIAFDMDDTLSVTKSPMSDEMGDLLVKLLDKYEVCIISGGKFEQFQLQVIQRLEASPEQLHKLHIMPTCGTRYYRYDDLKDEWSLQYSEDLSSSQRQEIIKVLETTAKQVGVWADKPYGEIIEDRGSQITYSVLGQEAPAEAKYQWDAEYSHLRQQMRDKVAQLLPNLEVRLGGKTSIDVTQLGIDKAHGMRRLIEATNISQDDILFIGDNLQEGGNDYPVKAMGIDSIEVDRWQDTALVLRGILGVTSSR